MLALAKLNGAYLSPTKQKIEDWCKENGKYRERQSWAHNPFFPVVQHGPVHALVESVLAVRGQIRACVEAMSSSESSRHDFKRDKNIVKPESTRACRVGSRIDLKVVSTRL